MVIQFGKNLGTKMQFQFVSGGPLLRQKAEAVEALGGEGDVVGNDHWGARADDDEVEGVPGVPAF